MGHNQHEFARILEELVSQDPPHSAPDTEEKPKPWTPNWIFIKAQPSTPVNPPVAVVYPAAKKPPRPNIKTEKPARQEPYIALDQLGKEAIEALRAFFTMAGEPCPALFRRSELRRLYHRKAKTLHPDVTGKADDGKFRKLAEQYGRAQRTIKMSLAKK